MKYNLKILRKIDALNSRIKVIERFQYHQIALSYIIITFILGIALKVIL